MSLSAQQQKSNWLASPSLAAISQLRSQISFALLLAEPEERKGREQGGSTKDIARRQAEGSCTGSRNAAPTWREMHSSIPQSPGCIFPYKGCEQKAASILREYWWLRCLYACKGCTSRSLCMLTKRAGIDFSIKNCRKQLKYGAISWPDWHFSCKNADYSQVWGSAQLEYMPLSMNSV